MTIKPIRNEDDLKRAFRRLEKVFQAEEGLSLIHICCVAIPERMPPLTSARCGWKQAVRGETANLRIGQNSRPEGRSSARWSDYEANKDVEVR